MFNVGAHVKCIEGISHLERGNIYTVKAVRDSFVYLKEILGGWHPARFELVDDGRTSRTTDPITSKGKRKVNKYEEAVLDALAMDAKQSSPTGFTGKDIAAFSEMPLNCITPRFAPLRRKGLIKDSGTKRDKQIVWVLA